MPLHPAKLGDAPNGRAPGMPYSLLYEDLYHAEDGAWAQAREVFLAGNGLPERWRGRERFVILETGFGLGNNFLAAWQAWRADPERCDELIFISVEKHPLDHATLMAVHADKADEALQLAERLRAAWPPLTPGWHGLEFDEPALQPSPQAPCPRVRLQLGLGDVADLLPSLLAQADAFFLDGFAPDKNPDMWDAQLLSRLHRLAAPEATAATWTIARSVREGLAAAGFAVKQMQGCGSKRDMLTARYAPRHVAPPPPGGLWPPPEHRHAVVVGAGLAGASAAWSLCRAGWRVTLLERHPGPAQATSGNPGGLFHSIVHGEDGVHARAHRAAVLALWRRASRWLAEGRLKGAANGLLRLDPKTGDDDARQLLNRLGLPEDHVRWMDAHEGASACGLAIPSGGWWFAQAGWLHPAGLAELLLEEAAQRAPGTLTRRFGVEVAALRPGPSDAAAGASEWTLLDPAGGVLARSGTVVLANALGALPLLASLPPEHAVSLPPLSPVRGQITVVPGQADLPRVPVAGSGYALTLDAQTLLCGATTQHHDDDPTVRAADHVRNVAHAERLGVPGLQARWNAHPETIQGRVGWRAVTPDRLPLVGPPAWSEARLKAVARLRLDQPRMLPRTRDTQGGLYLLSGLGSRGIAWSLLAGDLLAHWVTGTPCPVEVDLRDALDPARFAARQARHPGGQSKP